MSQDAKEFVKQISQAKAYVLKASATMKKHVGEISQHPDLAALPPEVILELKRYNQGEQAFEETFARIVTILPPP